MQIVWKGFMFSFFFTDYVLPVKFVSGSPEFTHHITATFNLTFNRYHFLGLFSRRQIGNIFLTFPRKQVLTFQICMKYQKLFSGKNKKKYFKMSSENFTQSAKR